MKKLTAYLCAFTCAATLLSPTAVSNAAGNANLTDTLTVAPITSVSNVNYGSVSTKSVDENTLPVIVESGDINSSWTKSNIHISPGQQQDYPLHIDKKATVSGSISSTFTSSTGTISVSIKDMNGTSIISSSVSSYSNASSISSKILEPGDYTVSVSSVYNANAYYDITLIGFDARETASISLNKSYYFSTNSDIYRKVTVKKASCLAVQSFTTSRSGNIFGTYVTLCDKNKKELSARTHSTSSNKYALAYGVKPGTYYIKVSSNTINYINSLTVKTLKNGATTATSKKKAKKVTSSAKNYIIPASTKKTSNWFKFTFKSKKKHTLTVQYQGTEKVIAEVYNGSKKVTSRTLYGGSKLKLQYKTLNGLGTVTTWPTGTYYVKITKYAKTDSGLISIKVK